ncbi:MAG: FIST C-terminal domain-containing protein [Polaromonas sp.]|uniref:FIST signal transduction protein n=1 Tax=Polaromonas sp. TaxID=1869339 RepID=UPI002488088E|nr:FIST N-terminal domain-containing protein [Polaromonas sp.]MDI1269317.1 FIST C-terminal domain-containing protein [Polaromonas sp.]MDO9115109.1 FIST C-terminal domain-containing protein [Polaromonas sp.]MDP1888884.1 FIST C-terminal domain-containing protein [Polaromonas sp.]
MKLFPYGHATHPQWRMAAGLVLAQLRAQMALHGYASSPGLGLLYITDHYTAQAQDILDFLGAELPEITDWAGTVGIGIASNNVEYFDEPALAVMLCELPSDQYRVFSGVSPLPPPGASHFQAHTALVHADAGTPDVAELIAEMAERTSSGYVFGGLASSRGKAVQFALSGSGNVKGQGAASGVFSGGLSGVAFAQGAGLMSRVTQGCQPVSREHEITACDANVVTELDGQSALDVMLADLGVSLDAPREALEKVRTTLVGLSSADAALQDGRIRRPGQFGADVLVRHIIGLDPARQGVAIAEVPSPGMRLAFCERNAEAARADLVRVCAEIREELEPEELTLEVASALSASEAESAPHPARRIAGAIYISCAGRGGPHFGAPSAELQIVRRALGDVPLVGFFAGGEIARHNLYGYTGVLTVFTAAD